jgi:hypothetical protein
VQDLLDDIQTTDANMEALFLTGDNAGVLRFRTTTDSFKFVFPESDFRDELGFTGTISSTYDGSTYYYIDTPLTPKSIWIPTYASADRGYFQLDQGSVFRGARTLSGNLVGIATGELIRTREIDISHELSKRVIESAGTSANEQARSLERFMRLARTETPNSGSSVSPKGFYFFYDYTDLQPLSAMSTSDGINEEYSSSADTHVFVMPASMGMDDPSMSLRRTRSRVNVSFEMNTATAPTWDAAP